MNRLKITIKNRELRTKRTRSNIFGTATRPRLSVHISNRHITAQLINDDAGQTLLYLSSVGTKVPGAVKGTMTDKAKAIGSEVAKKAKAIKIDSVVFDRGPKLYHGRLKALADAAREGGLKF